MEETTLLSAPGIFYAFGYWLSAALFIHLNQRKQNGLKLYVAQLAFLLLIGVFVIMTDTNLPYYYLPCMMTVLILVFLMIRVCCEMPRLNAAYFCARAFILGEFASSVEWQCYYYEKKILSGNDYGIVSVLTFIGVYFLVIFCMYLAEKKYRESNIKLQITRNEFFRTFLIAFGMYLISNISNIYQSSSVNSSFSSEIYFIRTLADFGGVLMLYAYHLQLQELNDRVEIEMLQQMLEVQYSNYQMSEQSVALVHQKYHDLKHQIAFLKEEITSPEKLFYLEQMSEEIQSFMIQSNTGNRVLDTILTAKKLQCKTQKIQMTCIVDGACLEFMNPMDLSALFGNALDNAIESVMQIQDPDERLIHVSVCKKKKFVVIGIGNACRGNVTFKDGLPQSTKEDKRFHGFGTKSIQDIVRRYGGGVTFHAKNDWFELKATLSTGEHLDIIKGKC